MKIQMQQENERTRTVQVGVFCCSILFSDDVILCPFGPAAFNVSIVRVWDDRWKKMEHLWGDN